MTSRDALRRAVAAPGWALAGLLSPTAAYLLALLAAAATRRTATVGEDPGGRVVVLVPAHDEAGQIEATVAALLVQRRPAGETHVVVIADNCTDATAALARAAGATVWERTAPEDRGKGQALAWALAQVWTTWPDVAAVGIVDADCLATPDLVAAWSAELRHAGAVQADYRGSNPDASTAAARRWAGFALQHHVRGSGKTVLGVSCGLFGTGMAFGADTLRRVPWTSFSITEDREYHVRLVEAGEVVRYTTAAAVDSPMPLTEREARSQQLRWETGNADLVRETVPRLLREGLRRRDVQRLHAGAEQLVPAQSLVLGGGVAACALGAVAGDRRLLGLAAGTVAGQVGFVLGGLAVADAPRPVWVALATAPRALASKLTQTWRIGRGGASQDWVRTARAGQPG